MLSERHSDNAFSQLYFNSMIVRASCFNCKYTNIDRAGDITIGDFGE